MEMACQLPPGPWRPSTRPPITTDHPRAGAEIEAPSPEPKSTPSVSGGGGKAGYGVTHTPGKAGWGAISYG
jgi:hypothetical protein